MDWTVATYLAYLAIAVPLTIWVARTLSRNGVIFLADVFTDRAELAQAVNRLLVVGFYLVNLGFVTLYLRVDTTVRTAQGMVETLSVKLGVVMLVLGLLHLTNVLVFNSIRRRATLERPRVAPATPQPTYTPLAPQHQG